MLDGNLSRRVVLRMIGSAFCGIGAFAISQGISADDSKAGEEKKATGDKNESNGKKKPGKDKKNDAEKNDPGKKDPDKKKAAEDKKKDSEEEIPLKKVPEVVRKAANKAISGAKWELAHLVTEDDEKFYELEGTDSKGRAVSVTVAPDGTVEEVVTEIPLKAVPETVTAAIKAKMPRFKAELAFEISEDGKVTGYDLEGRRPRDKHDISVHVSADGETIEIDEDE